MIRTNMALLAVVADKAVVETTPHLAHLSVKPLWGSLIWLQTNRTPTKRTKYWIVTKKRCYWNLAFKYDVMQKKVSRLIQDEWFMLLQNCMLYFTLLLTVNVNAMGLHIMQTLFLPFKLRKAPNILWSKLLSTLK